MKHDTRSVARCFYLEFWHENAKPNVQRVYVQAVVKEVWRSFGRRKHVARHCNYRLVLSLHSRYRQNTKNRLPPKNYRRWHHRQKLPSYFGFSASAKVVTTAEKLSPYLVLPLSPKSIPPKIEKPPTAEKLPPYGITAPPRLCLPKKALPAITPEIS